MTDVSAAAATAAPPAAAPSAWKDPRGFGFRDILDIVNPLQHVPIISSIYRWITGDRPGEAARIAGDALYGGPIGVAVGVVGAALEDSKGRDVGEQVLAAVFGSDATPTRIAAAAPTALPASGPALVAAQPAAPPQPTATPPVPVHLDHAPMPLFGGIAQPTPSMNAAATDPSQAFKAHNANLERHIAPEKSGGFTPTPLVPLVPPPGSLPAAPQVPAATARSQPLDISQKMLDALDKYMHLEQERERKAGAPSAAPAVDLAL
jgi:hypothetical protein